ncbi:MAG: exodeoxyribonuclease VII large subunit [Candidatus Aenigmatarchaeota archaeon]
MDDRSLYRFSLILSVAGILFILVLVHFTGPEAVKVSSIDSDHVGQRIQTQGQIEGLHTTETGHLFFHVKDERDEIRVVVFREDLAEMGLNRKLIQNGDVVSITGDVDTWNGQLEIVPTRIEIVS